MNVTVSLSDDLDEFVKTRVASGLNSSASEVFSEALRLMETHQQTADVAKLDWLREAYRIGIASGDAKEIDIEEVIAEARAQHLPSRVG